jgi:hypothetical protein
VPLERSTHDVNTSVGEHAHRNVHADSDVTAKAGLRKPERKLEHLAEQFGELVSLERWEKQTGSEQRAVAALEAGKSLHRDHRALVEAEDWLVSKARTTSSKQGQHLATRDRPADVAPHQAEALVYSRKDATESVDLAVARGLEDDDEGPRCTRRVYDDEATKVGSGLPDPLKLSDKLARRVLECMHQQVTLLATDSAHAPGTRPHALAHRHRCDAGLGAHPRQLVRKAGAWPAV